MQAAQSLGIDLPLKALVWQDEAGATWVSCNDPSWLARRHAVDGMPQVGMMATALDAVIREAIAAP